MNQFKITSKYYTFNKILSDETIYDKLIYIPNDDIQNYPFCRINLLLEWIGYWYLKLSNLNQIKLWVPV